MPIPSELQLVHRPPRQLQRSFAEEVREGLTRREKAIPCRFLYDAVGSQLFEQICELPEYYLTRAEREILERHGAEIADRVPSGTLVELGSGSSLKTRILLRACLSRHPDLHYIPIDISREILHESARGLLRDFEGIQVSAIEAEYEEALGLLDSVADPQRTILWMGSNLGNYEPSEARAFLRRVRQQLRGGSALLLGVDLRKDPALIERAYDDSRGVTARFSLNLLERINRELGGQFDTDQFCHRALYDESAGCISISLESLEDQRVRIDGLDLTVAFRAGERLHVENSYKYSEEDLDEMAREIGLRPAERWYDSQRRFLVVLLRAES